MPQVSLEYEHPPVATPQSAIPVGVESSEITRLHMFITLEPPLLQPPEVDLRVLELFSFPFPDIPHSESFIASGRGISAPAPSLCSIPFQSPTPYAITPDPDHSPQPFQSTYPHNPFCSSAKATGEHIYQPFPSVALYVPYPSPPLARTLLSYNLGYYRAGLGFGGGRTSGACDNSVQFLQVVLGRERLLGCTRYGCVQGIWGVGVDQRRRCDSRKQKMEIVGSFRRSSVGCPRCALPIGGDRRGV